MSNVRRRYRNSRIPQSAFASWIFVWLLEACAPAPLLRWPTLTYRNLVAANRMIFLAPVWSRDVQAQAIKVSRLGSRLVCADFQRVHRIGQTRPTKVQILVTEGTFEEDILKRYSSQKSDDDEKLYSRAMIEVSSFTWSAYRLTSEPEIRAHRVRVSENLSSTIYANQT